MDVSPILDNLNDAQRQAVTAAPCNQLILAGAGSGKTRVLVHRIAWLIQVEQVSPYSILAVTFTNKAAREMRGRIEELLGLNPRGMWVGTFHGIAHRLLKAHWQEAGLPQNFQILDSDDQLRLIKRVSQQLGLDEKRWPPRQSQWFINAQKDEGLRPDYIQQTGDPYVTTMVRIYREYEAACERGGMVDFGELLLRSHEVWLNKPDILAHYQQRFPFILVDEFQDTNTIQYAWLRVLAGKQCRVTAVGDDDQSIYGWRGAKIENIQRFEDDFTGTETVRLEQNYRSTATILDAANAVIANNQGRLGKTLHTDGEKGQPIGLYAAFNEQDEARYIVDSIEDWVRQGRSRADSAILYRSNAQSRVLEEALLREGIPYRIYGGQRFYERLEIRNALAYLRLMASRHDDAAFERVINTPTRGIGAKTVDNIRLFAREQGCSLWQAAVQMVNNKGLSARAGNAVLAFLQLVDKLQGDTVDQTLDAIVDVVIRDSGLYDFHKSEKGEKGQARIENLEELVNACRAFDNEDPETPDLNAFLDTAALDAGDTQADEHEEAVQLMTLHSAKGLEFPLVFLAGAEENLFPHRMSAEEPGRLEEERRLCYVGITRAMEQLVISYAESRRMHGQDNYNSISRFVREIPPQLIEEVRLKNTVSRPVSFQRGQYQEDEFSNSVNKSLSDEDASTGFYLGQRVKHSIFGEGVILQFEGDGNKARVQVNFDDQGSKWLVLQFAKLEAL
ncbi:DNA helicase II [Pseudomaricurvus alkylphenolicus]|uniref:DNA helicase II n=1 Tax=Pseudomaricurvus alkylphenolicus TaxID=1306991 RepID=UPI00141FC1ED|nr:DNA helicase II [Pseudomaricurvus alkylphenolicus]NIB39471.1 DNA helicase II [Pseudomaricurvus alkylphenolicus]